MVKRKKETFLLVEVNSQMLLKLNMLQGLNF